MYCTNCGEKITGNALFCVKCGTAVHNEPATKGDMINTNYNYLGNSSSGNGTSTASLVLGIMSIIFTIFTFIGAIGFRVYATESLDVKVYDKFSSNFDAEKVLIAFILSFLPLILSIVGLSLAISSRSKIKNGKNTAGLVLNIITIVALVIQTIIVITI